MQYGGVGRLSYRPRPRATLPSQQIRSKILKQKPRKGTSVFADKPVSLLSRTGIYQEMRQLYHPEGLNFIDCHIHLGILGQGHSALRQETLPIFTALWFDSQFQ